MVLLFIYIYTHTYQTNAKISPTKISPTKFSPFPFIFFRIWLGPVCEMAHRESTHARACENPTSTWALIMSNPRAPPHARRPERERER